VAGEFWRSVAVFCLGLIYPAVAAAELVEVRSIDGSGNNLANTSFGQAGTQLLRMAPAAYPGDGSGSQILQSPSRENPRVISNTIAAQGSLVLPNSHGMSDFVWVWGQFLDHDIDLTTNSSSFGTAPIPVPPGDILGPMPIPLDRSKHDLTTGTTAVPRQQINEITAFIDASNVYGSDSSRASELRTFSGGKLKSRIVNGEELLPLDSGGSILAGDIRADEQVGLTAMHTLFVREHNRLATEMANRTPTASDEQIYQTVRKIVGAQMQVITYHEFLPAVLGPHSPDPEAFNYDPSLDPGVANEFSTALYRFGHTMLAPNLQLVDNEGNPVGELPLRNAFMQPAFLETAGHIDLLFNGIATQAAQEIDNLIVDDVRNFLFGPPGAGGLDLASLNIQRGRDHGLPDYNTVREAYGLEAVEQFDQITSDPVIQAALQSLYGSVDNIDPWVGALAEDHLDGATTGELINVALVDQFLRLRDGDRFFYLNDTDLFGDEITGLIGDISQTTLGALITRNTGALQAQGNVFFVPETGASLFWLAVGSIALPAIAARRRRPLLTKVA